MKPILFNTEMVQAILDRRKTQTRRLIKPQPTFSQNAGFCVDGACYGLGFTDRGTQENFISCKSKYKVGDILYVRETFQTTYNEEKKQWDAIYKADGGFWHDDDGTIKWKPSIHMPKEFSRIFLEVTDVRVERLQDISEEDAMLEGIAFKRIKNDVCYWDYVNKKMTFPNRPDLSFETLWQSLKPKDGYTWNDNPFVWVYEFKQVKK